MYDGEIATTSQELSKKAKETAESAYKFTEVFVNQNEVDEFIYYLVNEGGYLASAKETEKLFSMSFGDMSIQSALFKIGAVTYKNHSFIICRSDKSAPEKDFKFGVVSVIADNRKVKNNEDRRKDMDINQDKISKIVKQVLSELDSGVKSSGEIPKTSRAAMLTKLENYEIKEFPIPELGDDDILVKVEGCGICGTDAHEFKRDPFGLIPLVLGHEGTGEIVKMGKNVKKDSAGKPLNIGDKVVTCMIFKDNPDITMFDLNKQNVGGADVYGLLPDDDVHLNGWFADYLVVRGGSTIFNVSDLDLESRILIEPCAVLIHAVERAKSTGILRFNSRVAVQGCGPIGLICIAVLRTMGIENIVAIDGQQKRLDFAKEMGATKSVNFTEYKSTEELADAVKDTFGGHLADFAFQCTGNPKAHSNIYKFVRNGGGLCELGFFINGGDATINPHFDICSKELTIVGSWVYTLRDYATTFDFLKRAKGIGLPMNKLITHKFPLSEINEAHRTNLKMEGLKIAIINER